MDVAVQTSRNGQGIFAQRDFAQDEVLYEVTGIFISGDEDEAISDSIRDNAFRYSADAYISPEDTIGDFQNHSCAPNAKVIRSGAGLYVVAAAPIPTGEEVFIDYSTITGADDVWVMACNCGSSGCRTTITSFDALPREVRDTYVNAGMVPKYILES